MKWAIENTSCFKDIKNHNKNGKVVCFSPKIFDWSRMFWLVKESKSLNGQWLVSQLLILHPNCDGHSQIINHNKGIPNSLLPFPIWKVRAVSPISVLCNFPPFLLKPPFITNQRSLWRRATPLIAGQPAPSAACVIPPLRLLPRPA